MEAVVYHGVTPLHARLSKRMTASIESHFATLKYKVDKFRQHITSKKVEILAVLSSYQSHATSEDEFQRIFECLDSIEELREYMTRRTGSVAVFFPLNMPLYALVLYGMIPALSADNVYVRAPQRMTNLMHLLEPLLDIGTYIPNLKIVYTARDEFVQNYVMFADVIIFTGKLANAQYVLRKCKKDSLFLFNGWGCNPVVVGEGADLDMAAKKTVQARLFSGGQDCAGPDSILVPKEHADEFVTKLKANLAEVKIGSYSDPTVTIGPLADEEQIRLIGSIFLKASNRIVHGGVIDYVTLTIEPTIIVGKLTEAMNFEELFAPVIFVSIYEDMEQLARYFEHPSYIANEMYITLFGSCKYVESLQKSIVVKDKAIFDVDRGNDEFGGYSMGASFVASNRRIVPKPILVPREIYDYLQPGSAGHKLSPGTQAKIGKQVRKAMLDFFSSNLIFGFVFGSVARQQATGASDINTMVVLEHNDSSQIRQYDSWLRCLHERHQLTFKETLSVTILTIDELNDLVSNLTSAGKTTCLNSTVITTEALSGAHCGVSGDKKLSVEYGKRLMPYSAVNKSTKLSSLGESKSLEKLPQTKASYQGKFVDSSSSSADSMLPCTTTKSTKGSGLAYPRAREDGVMPSKNPKTKTIRDFCRRWVCVKASTKRLTGTVGRLSIS